MSKWKIFSKIPSFCICHWGGGAVDVDLEKRFPLTPALCSPYQLVVVSNVSCSIGNCGFIGEPVQNSTIYGRTHNIFFSPIVPNTLKMFVLVVRGELYDKPILHGIRWATLNKESGFELSGRLKPFFLTSHTLLKDKTVNKDTIKNGLWRIWTISYGSGSSYPDEENSYFGGFPILALRLGAPQKSRAQLHDSSPPPPLSAFFVKELIILCLRAILMLKCILVNYKK